MNNNHYICGILILLQIMLPQKSHAQSDRQNNIVSTTMLDSLGTQSIMTVQYYDGLGRPDILAAGGISPNGNYVYTKTEYNQAGLESRKWLPATGGTSADYIDADIMESYSSQTYDDSFAFSEISYDALGRPVIRTTPGQRWYQNNKAVHIEYKANTAADNVKRYVMTSTANGTFTQRGYHDIATLTCERTTDEDGHSVEIYKDFMDKVILERRDGNNDTYYVYDKGLLCIVIPPLYQTTPTSDLLYKYRYDTLGRCIQKTLPGCAPITYEYDKCGRIAFVHDGRMTAGKYRFYLYDDLNRMVMQGICTGRNGSLSSVASTAVFGNGDTEIAGTGYYVNSHYHLTNPAVEIVNYYDNYDFLSAQAVMGIPGNNSLGKSSHANSTSLLTGQIISTSDGRLLCSAFYYDQKGNMTDKRETTLDGGTLCTATTYSFTGKPLTVNSVLNRKGTTRNVLQQNTYDDVTDKLANQSHKYKELQAPINTATYSYDDLGRISILGKQSGNLATQYTYDLHGWLTRIHSEVNSSGRLIFDEELQYAQGGSPCYNGNIRRTKFITPDYPMGEGYYHGYEYSYDGMNRLINASFGFGPVNTEYGMYTNFYAETMSYDANSNIQSMIRHGVTNAGHYGVIDNLTYSYYGNRLYGVFDQAENLLTAGAFDFKDNRMPGSNAPEYGYDNCGSVTHDINKGITQVEYDLLGNPVRIQFCDHNITENIYTADGRKLKTIHRTSVPRSDMLGIGATATLPASETLAVDSTEYIGNYICDNGTVKRYLFEGGYLALNTNTCSSRYFFQDHLGNNRVVTNSTGNTQQINNYYPYGGTTAISTEPGYQQYKYNGKEYDPMHGLNQYDYIARQYNPENSRFNSMDPLCEKYYHISPYAYCAGNPVRYIDPDGRDWYSYNGLYKWKNSTAKFFEDGKGNKWDNIGHTYTDKKSNTYFSLFGQTYKKNDVNLKAIMAIDNAIIENAAYIGRNINIFDGNTEDAPTSNFSDMYPIKKDDSLLRIHEEFYKKTISYGLNNKNQLNAIITQTSNISMGFAKINHKFNYINMGSYGLAGRNSEIYLTFNNIKGKDIILIHFPTSIGVQHQNFFKKLYKSFITK